MVKNDNFKEYNGMWMETYTGKKIDVGTIKPSDIVWKDLIIPLSRECRFGNHSLIFYTVAQHTINCIRLAQLMGEDKLLLKYLLGHDLSEAYLIDIPRPLKQHLKEYYVIEKKVQNVIWEFLGLPVPDKDMENRILKYDNEILYWEGKFIKHNIDNWSEKYKSIDGVPELTSDWFKEFLPSEIEEEFLKIIEEVLNIEVKEKH